MTPNRIFWNPARFFLMINTLKIYCIKQIVLRNYIFYIGKGLNIKFCESGYWLGIIGYYTLFVICIGWYTNLCSPWLVIFLMIHSKINVWISDSTDFVSSREYLCDLRALGIHFHVKFAKWDFWYRYWSLS